MFDFYSDVNSTTTASSNNDVRHFKIVECNIFVFNGTVAIVLYMYIAVHYAQCLNDFGCCGDSGHV